MTASGTHCFLLLGKLFPVGVVLAATLSNVCFNSITFLKMNAQNEGDGQDSFEDQFQLSITLNNS